MFHMVQTFELPEKVTEFIDFIKNLGSDLYSVSTSIEDFDFTLVNLMFEDETELALEFYRSSVSLEDIACLLLDNLEVEENLILDGLGLSY